MQRMQTAQICRVMVTISK